MHQRISEAMYECDNNPDIAVLTLTQDGRKAMQETASVIRDAVTRFSNRLADDANTFADGLTGDVKRLQALTSRAREVSDEMESSSELGNGLVDELFVIESELNLLAQKVMAKEARMEAMLADLDDPVSALDRLEAKYPTVRRPYLAAFGR
jgi:hypothetical protein